MDRLTWGGHGDPYLLPPRSMVRGGRPGKLWRACHRGGIISRRRSFVQGHYRTVNSRPALYKAAERRLNGRGAPRSNLPLFGQVASCEYSINIGRRCAASPDGITELRERSPTDNPATSRITTPHRGKVCAKRKWHPANSGGMLSQPVGRFADQSRCACPIACHAVAYMAYNEV